MINCFLTVTRMANSSHKRDSRQPKPPAIRTKYRSIFFNKSFDRPQMIRELLQHRCIEIDLFLRLLPAPLLDGFPDPRQGLYTITGIKARCINHMPVPSAAG